MTIFEMAIKEELVGIVGSEHVFDDPETLDKYAKDYSLVQPRMPSYVVYPQNTEEIQGIVRYANCIGSVIFGQINGTNTVSLARGGETGEAS